MQSLIFHAFGSIKSDVIAEHSISNVRLINWRWYTCTEWKYPTNEYSMSCKQCRELRKKTIFVTIQNDIYLSFLCCITDTITSILPKIAANIMKPITKHLMTIKILEAAVDESTILLFSSESGTLVDDIKSFMLKKLCIDDCVKRFSKWCTFCVSLS